MQAIQIEILKPDALQLIEGMQNLKLIRIKSEKTDTGAALQSYLKKMRRNKNVPAAEEISEIIHDVRKERYAKSKL